MAPHFFRLSGAILSQLSPEASGLSTGNGSVGFQTRPSVERACVLRARWRTDTSRVQRMSRAW
eukprot:147872-Pyramimonas_sp.AAC.1